MGFIHRDIKPGNIMLREDGTALLSDFGAARVAESATLATLTMGTPAYMSPEQILGRELRPQSDIYSFGIVLYEMLAGRRPFTGDEDGLTGTGTISRLREAHLRLDPPDPAQLNPAIPPALSGVVLKSMAKEDEDRWPNVLSLVDAWDTALGSASRRGRAGALAAASAASAIETVVVPMGSSSGAPAGVQAAPTGNQAPPTGKSASPPTGGSAPPPVQAEQPRKGGRPILLIAAAAAGLLVLGLVFWQFIMPSLAASRTAQPPVDTTATSIALETLARDATATAESAAQAAAAEQAQQTATAQAETSAAETASAAAEATRQASEAAAAATAEAMATEQALAQVNATEGRRRAAARCRKRDRRASAASATAEATAAAATAQAYATEPIATVTATPTIQPTPTAAPTATTAPPAPTRTAVPGSPSNAPGVVLDFESATAWRRGAQPYGDLTRVTDPVHSGAYSAKLAYNFPAVQDNFVVFQARPATPISGQPAALYAWVYGDGSGHFLNAWLQDRSGQVRQYTFGAIKHQGWQQMTAPLDDAAGWPNVHISGPDSGKLAFPASLAALVLDGVPDGTASNGAIHIDDLRSAVEGAPQAPAGATPYASTSAPAAGAALSGRIAVPIFASERKSTICMSATLVARTSGGCANAPASRI
jgi:serine/threonine-protein kinase